MNGIWPRKDLSTLLKLGCSLFLALAVLAASLPQPAQAQATTTCRTNHLVVEGNTKPYIAHTYNLRWREIAEANDMNPAEKVEVGQLLCIPPQDETEETGPTPEGESKADIVITIVGSQVGIDVDDFTDDHTYLVKARDVNVGVGGWERLGRITVTEDDALSFSFRLPDDLSDIAILNVCLKDQNTDELICRRVVNP